MRHGRALLEFDATQAKWRVVALDEANLGREFATATVPDILRQR